MEVYTKHETYSFGVSLRKLNQYKYKKTGIPPIKNVPFGSGNENAVWLEPTLVAKYMPNDRGSLRQPVLKGIRQNKLAKDCKELE